MIITQKNAQKLIKEGRATATNEIKDNIGQYHAVLTRHDIHRTDHCANNNDKIKIVGHC